MTTQTADSSSTATEISLIDALRMAVEIQQARQYDAAETLYQRILQVAPRQPDALHLLGMLHHQTGRSDEGIKLIEQAITIEPSFAGYQNNLGNIHAIHGRVSEATRAYERALELAPDDADLHNNLGALYKNARRFDEARACYERAIELDSRHINALNNMGLLYAELGARPQAIRYYVQSLELMPGNSSARKLLGTTYYALGRIADAAEVYRQWLEIEPDQPVARHHYAACTGQNVPDRAADEYVEQTFDRFAESFEATLNERLHYQAPQLCVDLLAEIMPAPLRQYAVLDAGCGTGLCGPLLAPWSQTLAGVDLSRGMLDLAQTKGVYQDLYKAELGEFLQLSPAQWDVIVSADTLCYFGDLQPVMRTAAESLRPGGTLVFTVEALEGAGTVQPGPDQAGTFHIQPHGRYAHAGAYLADALGQAGLQVLALRDAVLRQEGGKPVQGWLVAARRPGRATA
ncbi:MAG: tetratricopeptide repeat protein [Leptothrix sp. (in: b-proteobacteria)]